MILDLASIVTQTNNVLKALQANLPSSISGIPSKLDLGRVLENSKLQIISFDEKIPPEKNLTGKQVTHSDSSEVDSFILKGQRIFATIPDKADPSRLNLYDRKEDGKMDIRKVIPLVNEKGESYKEGTIDTEAIRFFQKDGKTFALIASEGASIGYDNAKKLGKLGTEECKRDPKIYLAEVVMENGEPTKLQVQKEIATPERYRHQVEVNKNEPKLSKEIKGPRANGSFESISVSSDGKKAFLITEFPLIEDGEMATTKSTGLARCLEINLENGVTKEHAYVLDKIVPTEKAQALINQGHKIANEENGVVSIVNNPFDKDSYFVMERSFLRITDKSEKDEKGNPLTRHAENSIRIYQINKSAATDTSNIDVLKEKDITTVNKKPFLDFKDLNKLFSDQGINPDTNKPVAVDNFEGMTLLYNSSKQNWELICVTDNNSNKKIQGGTQFLTISLNEAQ